MNLFVQWAKRSTSLWQRILILGFGAGLFLFLIPYLLIYIVTRIDEILGIRSLFLSQLSIIIGIIFLVVGGLIGFWTIMIQIVRAEGTPFPMIPTKRLITSGPFAMCRNPMTFGTISAYLGLSLIIGSPASVVIIVGLGALLLTYIKQIEEKELAMRFGDEYLQYKSITPFIIPNPDNLFKK